MYRTRKNKPTLSLYNIRGKITPEGDWSLSVDRQGNSTRRQILWHIISAWAASHTYTNLSDDQLELEKDMSELPITICRVYPCTGRPLILLNKGNTSIDPTINIPPVLIFWEDMQSLMDTPNNPKTKNIMINETHSQEHYLFDKWNLFTLVWLRFLLNLMTPTNNYGKRKVSDKNNALPVQSKVMWHYKRERGRTKWLQPTGLGPSVVSWI